MLAIVAIAFLTLLDVGLRSAPSVTIRGLNDELILCLGIAIASCMPSGCARAAHLKLDLLTAQPPRHAARAFGLMGTLLLLLFLLLVGTELFQLAMIYDARNQATVILNWQIAPFFYAMACLVLRCVPVRMIHVGPAAASIGAQGGGKGRAPGLLPAALMLGLAVPVWSNALDLVPGHDAPRGLQSGVTALLFFGHLPVRA